MEKMFVSSNHSVALGKDGMPYSWGFNNIANRLGVTSADREVSAKVEPVVMEAIFKSIQ